MYRFRDIYVYVMYYVYVTSGPSLLIESTDSMTKFIGADMDLPRHRRLISSSGRGIHNEKLRVDGVLCQVALIS